MMRFFAYVLWMFAIEPILNDRKTKTLKNFTEKIDLYK